MKHRRPLALFASLCFLSLVLVGCGAGVGSRGWAAAVQANDLLLITAHKGRLQAINSQTNDLVWTFPNDWHIDSGDARDLDGIYGEPVVHGSIVFVGDYNGYVYAFRPGDVDQNEPPVGYVNLDHAVIGGLTFDSATDTLFVSAGNDVYAIKASDLIEKIEEPATQVTISRIASTGGEVWGRPVLNGGRLYVSSLSGRLQALNPANGEEHWRYTTNGGFATTPLINGNTVLVAGFDRSLHAVDIQTGERRWKYETENWIWAQPVVDGNRVYIADFDGYVTALNLNDGTEVWRKKVANSPIVGTPALVNGTLIVGAQNGKLYGLNASDQNVNWTNDVRKKLQSDLVVLNSRVVLTPQGCFEVPEQDNEIYYLGVDASSGDLRSTGSVC